MYKEKINTIYKNGIIYANNTFTNSTFHLVGDKYPTKHKMEVGMGMMLIGVIFATSVPIHILADLVGYFIHGIGATPFVEYLTKSSINKKDNVKHRNKKQLPR